MDLHPHRTQNSYFLQQVAVIDSRILPDQVRNSHFSKRELRKPSIISASPCLSVMAGLQPSSCSAFVISARTSITSFSRSSPRETNDFSDPEVSRIASARSATLMDVPDPAL